MKANPKVLALCTALALSATSCNLFSPFDNPTSDAQLISAARACLDDGDYECARENYLKLSAESSDIANSELAFTILTENGAGMSAFAASFGAGGGAAGLNQFAVALAATASETKRLAIYEAYKIAITPNAIKDPTLNAFVRFTSATALAAEILAESVGDDGLLTETDIAGDGDSCDATSCLTIGCTAPANGKLVTGANFDLTTDPTGTSTLGMLNSAISAAQTGLNDMDAGGDFGSTDDSFGAIAGELSTSGCYRAGLFAQGLGK